MRNTIFGCPTPLENCFSTPMMVRECPSCCRYSGGLSAWQSRIYPKLRHRAAKPGHWLKKAARHLSLCQAAMQMLCST